MNIYPMWLFTLEIGAAQLRSVTEIAPKSPFLRVNSPILYSFRAGAKAIWHSVNIFLNSLILSRFLKVGPSGDHAVLGIAEEKRVRQSSQTNTPKIWKKKGLKR